VEKNIADSVLRGTRFDVYWLTVDINP